jgi:hypothetical protein
MRASLGKLPPGTRGFDCNARVTPDAAKRMAAAGYRFAVRYVRRSQQHDYDINAGEILSLLNAGLGVMIVQHVALPGWMPSAALGAAYGGVAAGEAHAAGLPRGVTLWCDLEGVDPDADAVSVIGFCNAWYDRAKAAGYEPGLYVGDSCGLTAQQLYRNLRFGLYWSSYNLNADNVPAVRGVCMKQRAYPAPEKRVAGVPFEYDEDVITGDALGGSPTLLLPWAG